MLPDAMMDDEDNLMDSSVRLCVFEFLNRTILGNASIYKEEFFLRRLHGLLADFIILHPTKVRELRRAADEAARTIQAYTQEGLEPPSNLQYHFESFLRSIGRLHERDPLGLQLALDYWPRSALPDVRHGTAAHILSSAHLLGSSDGRGALWRFVRQCGWGDSPHPLPPALFVPYLQMLRGLSSTPRAAAQCFAFLRQQSLQPSPVLIPESSRGDTSTIGGMGPVPSSPISWDHFFRSLHRYLCNLRVELPPTDTVYSQRSTGGAGVPLISRGITPLELEGLHCVLSLLTTIAEQDEASRLALAENPTWGAIPSLLGLVTCPVPIPLKARLVHALAALATPSLSASERSVESSVTTLVWHHLEASQILLTVPTTSCYQPRGVQTELEEVESRNEEYPLTRAMMHLLDALTGPVGPLSSSSTKVSTVPPLLGMGTRVPGLDPYLNYVIHSVFLPYSSRSYRSMEEKWLVCRLCLRLFLKFLRQYEPSSEDFTTRVVEVREGNSNVTGSTIVTTTTVAPPPGFHLMIQLHSKSELLRIILNIIDEVAGCLEESGPGTPDGKRERRLMEGCALGCLRVLRRALMLQGRFTALLSASSEDPLLLTGLDRLLLAANPRSGKHDHLLNIARYVSHAGWLPKHAPAALGILALATACPRSPSSAAQVHLLSLLTSSPQATAQVRHAFVECMEAEEDENAEFEEDKDIGPDEGDEEDGTVFGDSLLEISEGSSPNSSEPFKGLSIRGRAKEMVLRLLLQWLPQTPAPNLAHFFLGFHLSKDLRKTVFQQPGILGFPRTCLHALLALLDRGLANNPQATSPSVTQSAVLDITALRPRAPHSALLDLGYRLLYALCADPRTSEPVLRFLRSSSSAGGVAGGHYLTRHLLSIPIITVREVSGGALQKRCEVNALGQTSWLLRTVAVELKALAANRHHLQLTTLLRTLLSTPTVPRAQALGNTMRTVGPGWPSRAADVSELSVDGNRLGGEEEGKDEETTLQLSRSHLLPVGSLPPSGARPHDRLLIRVLEALNFSPEQTPSPNWEFFEPSQIQQVLRQCEVSVAPGGDSWPHVAPSCPALRLVNLDSLRRTLMDELQSIQVSQRQAIVTEMKEVLKYSKQHNHRKARAWGVVRCMEGWCQVTEVLFATTPSEALAPSLHLQLLLDVLQVVLKKTLATDVTSDLATLCSGVILLLLVNLRNLHLVAVREARLRCLPQKVGAGQTPMPGSQADTPVTTHIPGRNAASHGAEATLQANSAALKVILSGILQWIVSSAPPSQKLRINLYGALLNFLHVTCTEGDEWNIGIPSGVNFSNVSLSDSLRNTFLSPGYSSANRVKSQPTEEERSQRQACLEVMVGFGEGLVDVLCHDSTSGHDVCKMLALSCLETLVVLDTSTGPATTLSLLCSRGFLCHLVDSLLASDRTLQGVLEEDEGYAGGGEYSSGGTDLRPLYVYESKMAALCRIARSSRNGAEALLERKVMGCLSAMKVFDARPDGPFWTHADGTLNGEFVPPVAGRYLQIWLPALHLCDALLISLGSRNESCASQVAHFLVSHSEAVGAALRGAGAPRSGSTSQGHLQEIASLTGVVALAARHPGIIGPDEGAVPADPLWRVRKLMFSLLPRFLLPEDVPGAKTVSIQADEETGLCSLQVAAHLLLYVRRLSVPDGAVGETGGAADPRECRIVFSPSLSGAELVPSGDPRGTRTSAGRNIPVRTGGIGTSGPPLGLLVARLVSAVGLDASLAAAESQLYGQLASVPDMNSQELREFLPQGALMTAASMEAARAQAARYLGRRLQQTIRRRELLWFLADHCLLLLWVHLDHFLLRSFIPGDRGRPMSMNSTSRDHASWSVDVEEISRLKSGLVSVFNDGFCKRLIDTRQEVKDRGFVEALVRRIKRLIQFVPIS
ncbi:nuclear pore complex protein Nup205-like [Hetaerina americana]|uniref:nuclear pore complex protein Nup205-like n=1 Tax=Hetaerina americana TaxID=62018 RepID=UPI003A7F4174